MYIYSKRMISYGFLTLSYCYLTAILLLSYGIGSIMKGKWTDIEP